MDRYPELRLAMAVEGSVLLIIYCSFSFALLWSIAGIIMGSPRLLGGFITECLPLLPINGLSGAPAFSEIVGKLYCYPDRSTPCPKFLPVELSYYVLTFVLRMSELPPASFWYTAAEFVLLRENNVKNNSSEKFRLLTSRQLALFCRNSFRFSRVP